jgi:flagellar biogenesis protein FliO
MAMRWIAGTIGLLWLSACPAGLWAQAAPYGNSSPQSEAAPAGFGQSAAAQAGASPSLPPLTPRNPAARSEPAKRPDGLQAALTVGGSLAVVLGIFLLIAWALRRAAPGGFGTLPGEAFEVLGRAALGNRQQVQLLRLGNKLLLVCITAAGAATLTEITEPAEVGRLADLCRQSPTAGAAASLRQLFRRGEVRND